MRYVNTIPAFLALACTFFASSALAQDGSYDSSWSGDGRTRFSIGARNAFLNGMTAQSDGKVVLVGSTFDTPRPSWVARLQSNGEPDAGFGTSGTGVVMLSDLDGFPDGLMNGVSAQHDGRLLLVGTRSIAGAGGAVMLARLTSSGQPERGSDGAPVRLFQLSANPLSPSSGCTAAVVLPNGKIVAVGYVNGAVDAGNTDFAVARLNTDLTLDTGFNAGGERPGVQRIGFDEGGDNTDTAFGVAMQVDGKIVVVGRVTTLDGSYSIGVARVNVDGGLDAGFGNNGRVLFRLGVASGRPNSIALDRQQRIVLGGGSKFDGEPRFSFYLVRLRAADGSFDTSLNGQGWIRYPRADSATVQKILVQTDGKVVLGGDSNVNGGTFRALRVLEDGSPDPSFGVNGQSDGQYAPDDGSFESDTAQAFALDPGGRVLAAGQSFVEDGQRAIIGVARLTSERIFADGFE